MDPKLCTLPRDHIDDEYKFWPEEISKDTIPDVRRTTLFKPAPLDEEWIVGYPGVEAGHVIEVISVTISDQTNGSLTHDIEIYGQISITDNNDNTYDVYKRESDEADPLSPNHNELSLCRHPIAPFTMGKVQFTLTNKNTGLHIFTGEVHVVDYSFTADCKGDDECFTVKGKHGYDVTMVYAVVPLTVIAEICMNVIGPPDGENLYVDGDITMNGVSILGKKSFESPKLMGGQSRYYVKLSRTALAIPVYYWVVFEFSLTLGGKDFATGKLVYNPRSNWTVERKDCNIEGYVISVDAEYMCPYEYFARLTQTHRTIEEVTTSDGYVEVFSVVVGSWSSIPAVHGTIVVRDEDLAANIFPGTEIPPDNLTKEQNLTKIVLSLAWPDNWLVQENSCMNLELEDTEGNQICMGGFSFCDEHTLMHPLRYDRRRCVVVTGVDGYYAAVHYSVFRNGKKVKLTFEWNGQYNIVVYGSVFAEYSNTDYRSTYDEEYHRIIIFKRSRKEFVKVKSNSSIPFSKSWVTTPSDCEGLFVYVDLKVMGFNVAFPGNSIDNPVKKLWLDSDSSDPCPPLWVYDSSRNIRLGSIAVKVDWSSF